MPLNTELEHQGEFLFKYRSYLPLSILIIALLLAMNTYSDRLIHSKIYSIGVCVALIIGGVGLLIRILTVGYTPANTSGRNTKGQLADELNTTGFYSMVRHPLYLGNFLMWLAPGILTFHWWFVFSFILIYWLYYERIMMAEERFLIEKFGNEYLSWSKLTPPFLPHKFKWTKPKYPFSWKKVLKKEKNGLFALFTLFYIFKVIELNSISTHPNYTSNWQFWAFIGSAVIYFVLKFLKYRGVFDEKNR